MSLTTEIELGIFIIFSVVAMITSLTITNTKYLIYAAYSLIILGISTAILIADLDPAAFALYSAIHLLLYVGATVSFLVISFVLFKNLEIKGEIAKWSIPISVLIGAFLLGTMLITSPPLLTTPSALNLTRLADIIVGEYWFPTLILITALAATLIEAITLARRN
ncbi:NADH dehydrogenase subunit J [Sulfolobales archaeon HS-7]|nr:NADH dehydrogenase subunit J [Sulfolobales archaeon HS-7]